MRLLLTGAGGQFGTAFLAAASRRHSVVPTYHTPPAGGVGMDLADPARIVDVVRQARPDWIVHGAAWTDVDGCERDPARAKAVNGVATGALAQAARGAGARFCCISTDYVFDGEKGNYREGDAPNPIQAYGRSKLEGERLARSVLPDCLVARASAVFAPGKRNFVTWLLGELRQGRPVRIVRDQRLSPTLADDLASQVLALVEAGEAGVFHTAGATQLSRLQAAYEVADAERLDRTLITPVASAQLGWLAKRPADTTLDVAKVRRNAEPLTFAEALDRFHRPKA